MIDDRNKTELTKEVTRAASVYLDERGCKPIETEVCVGDSWIADLGGVLCPTQTELIDLKLLSRRPSYRDRETYEQWYAQARALQQVLTVLVEVKTSRSDFVGDKKWKLPIPTSLAYLAIPSGLIDKAELPTGWGLLSYNEAANCVRCLVAPTIQSVTMEQQRNVILAIAVRRDHHTRYERMRELNREIRAQQSEETSRIRFYKAMLAMSSIVKGEHESVEVALGRHGIKGIPAHYISELEKLWAIGLPNFRQDVENDAAPTGVE